MQGMLFQWYFLVEFGCLLQIESQLINATLVEDETVLTGIFIFPFTKVEIKPSGFISENCLKVHLIEMPPQIPLELV